MKILITGALGHIGSRLIRGLAGLSASEVVLLDNMATQRYASLFDLPRDVPFRFVQGDILSPATDVLFEGTDVVLHLAAITDAAGSFDREREVEEVNYQGTARVADLCARNGCRLIYLSTTSVYGTQSELVDEDCPIDALKPQSPYAGSKLRAERYVDELARTRGLRAITARFGTIFGTSRGMRFHTAVNKFVWQAVMGLPITVWRTALHQKRPYLDLGDAVRALRFIIETDRFDGRIYNVLTINATVAQIVEAIERAVGHPLAIELVDSPIMNQLSYEVSRARFEALGFQFRGDLAASIAETVALLEAANAAVSTSAARR